MNSMSENSSPSNWAKEPYIIAAARRSSRRQRWQTRAIMALWSFDPPYLVVERAADVRLLLNHPCSPGEVEGVLGHLYRGGVYHLPVDTDRAGPGSVGLLISLYHFLCPPDLPLGRREDLVDDLDLGRVDAPLSVETEGASYETTLAQALLVAIVGDGTVHGAQTRRPGGDYDTLHGVVEAVAGVGFVPLVHRADVELRHAHAGREVAGAEVQGRKALRGEGYVVHVEETLGALYLALDPYLAGIQTDGGL